MSCDSQPATAPAGQAPPETAGKSRGWFLTAGAETISVKEPPSVVRSGPRGCPVFSICLGCFP